MNNRLSVCPLSHRFNQGEIETIERLLGIDEVPQADDVIAEDFFADVDEGALDEFVDRLDEAGVSAHVYLPVRFEKVLQLDGLECGSAYALLDALEAMRGDLGLDDDEDERDPRFAKQRNVWKRFRKGAKTAIKERLVLDLVRM